MITRISIKTLSFLIAIFLFILFVVIMFNSHFLGKIHESGHMYAWKIMTGNNCSFDVEMTEAEGTFMSICKGKNKATELQIVITKYSGYGFTTLIGLITMTTPVSALGGAIFFTDTYKIVMISQTDFIGTPKIVVNLFVILLFFLVITAVCIQVSWIRYFIKKLKKK